MRAPKKRWPKGTWMRLRNGKLLRELMNTKGVSNMEVGMAAGCGRTFVSALVNERRNSCKPSTAEGIARRLDVPLELLFDVKTSAVSGSNDKAQRKAKAA